MNWSLISGVILIIGVFTVAFVECRWYQSGLVFYDISTKQMILPPTVSVHRARSWLTPNIPILSTLGKPCTCKGLKCGCCAGLDVREYDFNQKMCANVTYVPDQKEALLDVYLNDTNKARYGVSARNPSPICIPIMMPIPMAMCIQMSQVGLKGDNLHMCMDFVVRLHTTDAMELHFNCLSMGLDGFQYLDPNGKPVFPRKGAEEDNEQNSIDDDEYYDDTTEESPENFASEDEADNDEESDQANEVEEMEKDTEYYEDTDDPVNNEVEDEYEEEKIKEQDKKDHKKDNLIIVYETA